VTAFYQPSTRTRLAHEAAMHRLGGHVVGFSDAKMTRAGDFYQESIKDTVHMLEYYGDAIVMRHFQQGAPHEAARWSSVPVINAGDGWGEHPTQVLTDLYTVQRELGTVDGLTFLCIGDMRMRTMHSIGYALTQFDAEMIAVAPTRCRSPTSSRPSWPNRTSCPRGRARGRRHRRGRRHLHGAGRPGRLHQARARSGAGGRPTHARELPGHPRAAGQGQADAIILHSLPRMDELPPDVDATRHARYWQEAYYGVVMRMALLSPRPGRDGVGHRGHADPLRGRDLITTQEWTRRTSSTPCSTWPSTSSAAGAGRAARAAARQGAGDAVLLLLDPDPGELRGRGWPSWAATPSSSSPKTTQIAHGDTAKEIGEILGRYNDGIAIRQVDWGSATVHPRRRRRLAGAGAQHAVRPLPPVPGLADLLTIVERKGDPAG
jgi:aspartate carbamoyltransferase catalytic subunit